MNEVMSSGEPSILVIFGVTGDLSTKKILPSLWHLFRHDRLPGRLRIIGFSRREISDDEFRVSVHALIQKNGEANPSDAEIGRFLSLFTYHSGTFEDATAFKTLAENITSIESAWGQCANKLFYLAVPPSSYQAILENLAHSQLNLPCGGEKGWSRLLVEKPFGVDLVSAQALESLLLKYFTEEQVFRIDHYLFKEIIQGIENFRFSNNLFEHSWDNTTIDRIDIRLHETLGVERRGSFYDSVGALRDVGQNHLLMMLAAVVMEYPPGMTAESIRNNRASLLASLAPWESETLIKNTFRAQYRGYKDATGVRPDSVVETYFATKTELTGTRWKGVPLFMEAGKRLPEDRKEIVLTLKHPSLCHLCEIGPHRPNQIIFRLAPNDEIVIHFWAKKPGYEHILEERTLSFFLYKKEDRTQYVEEYAKILNAAMRGERKYFISDKEIDALWKFVDPIARAWKDGLVPLLEYDPGTHPTPELLRVEPDIVHHKITPEKGAVGIVGLGKMGANLALRLHEEGWKVIGYNKTLAATERLRVEGVRGADTIPELVRMLPHPRTVWLMVPHHAVDGVLDTLIPIFEKGDVVIDGGNSPYKESMRRASLLKERGISFLDVGVSGGPEGSRNGACLMIGGDRETFLRIEGLFRDIAVPGGYRYLGGSGAGHFVKMVHNGIEYGMMESIAEGFNLLQNSPFELRLTDVADIYQQQSVVTSRLVGWLKKGFDTYGEDLAEVSGSAGASGEGQWTLDAASEFGVEASGIQHALDARIESQKSPSYAGKLIQTMRNMFGGHIGHTDITA